MNPWAFHAHFEVWLLVITLSVGYWWLINKAATAKGTTVKQVVRKSQVTSYYIGVLLTWVAADWPVHDIAEQYLYSAHMGQHLVLSLIAPCAILGGTPAIVIDYLFAGTARRLRTMRKVLHPITTGVVYSGAVIVTHVPAFVNESLRDGWFHFAAHLLIYSAGLMMWFPVMNRSSNFPRYETFGKCFYLFTQSIIGNVPGAVLTFTTKPIYKAYELAPRPWGISVIDDQQLAAVIMKLGSVTTIWIAIMVVYFTAAKSETQAERSKRLIVLSDGSVRRGDGTMVLEAATVDS